VILRSFLRKFNDLELLQRIISYLGNDWIRVTAKKPNLLYEKSAKWLICFERINEIVLAEWRFTAETALRFDISRTHLPAEAIRIFRRDHQLPFWLISLECF